MQTARKIYSAVLMVAMICGTLSAKVYAASTDNANTTLKLAQNKDKGKDRKAACQARHQKKMQELGINQQQQDQIKALKEAYRSQNKPALEAMKANWMQLKELKKSGNANPEEVSAIKAQLKTQREALKPQREALRNQIMALLTPEQQTKMKALHAQHKGPHHKNSQ